MRLPTSARWKRDPMMTSGIIRGYRAKMNASIRIYRKSVLLSLTRRRTLSDEIAYGGIDLQLFSSDVYQAGNAIAARGEEYVPVYVDEAYRAGITHAANMIELKGIEASVGMGPADWRTIDALKVRNLSALKGISDEMSKQIIHEVTEGVRAGEGMSVIRARITDRVDKIGFTRADIMARTEVMTAANDASIQRYTQEGATGWEWYTTQDDRLCPQCAPLHGRKYKFGEVSPPPLHARCRCVALPTFED